MFPGWTALHDPLFIPAENDGSEHGLGMHDIVGRITSDPTEQFTFALPSPAPYPAEHATVHDEPDGISAGQSPVVIPVETGIALCKHGFGLQDPWMDEYAPAVHVMFSTPDCAYPASHAK